MIRYVDYDIVFQEVPDETTLAFNLSGCPHRCHGCHSPQLWEDTGSPLTPDVIDRFSERYPYITCVALMGGDADVATLTALATYVRHKGFKTAWYTGFSELPTGFDISLFDFIKTGPYIETLGGLKNSTTNQRFYRVENGQMTDCTYLFQTKSL